MYNKQQETPIDIVHHYLDNGASLRKTAQMHNIHYQTLFKWVKLYKNHGMESLLSNYKRPWNRAKRELEEKVVLLKEKDPSLTVRRAKEILNKDGTGISVKGIWGIWKRYGYAGFNKNRGHDFTQYCSWTKEAEIMHFEAKKLLDLRKVKESARILNSIPFLPRNESILEIPDNLLNLRRRIEKIPSLFEKMPLPSYLKKIEDLYSELKRKNLNYSAIRLGIIEIVSLAWSGSLEEILNRSKELKKLMKKKGSYYSYHLSESRILLRIGVSIAYVNFLRIERAFEIANSCGRSLKRRKDVSPYLMLNLGILYMNLDDYKEAEHWISKSLSSLDRESRKRAMGALAHIYLFMGDDKKARKVLKYSEFGGWVIGSKKLIFRSFSSLMNGKPQKAISLATESLSLLRKEDVKMGISGASSIIASAYCSLGEQLKAKHKLREIEPFLEKNKFKRGLSVLRILLSQNANYESRISLNKDILPTVNLALLLRNGDYWRALSYARKKGILIYFYKYIFFFPDVVINLLEKGKSTELPKALLKLPVFRKEIPVYSVKFLGCLIAYKNQKYLRLNLPPKDASFLIYLASSKSRSISVYKIYKNFWPSSKKPSKNLAHLLVRIRKALRLPSHFLYVKSNRLFFDCYFSTDYGEYSEYLAQAKALLKAHEWGFAKREYLQAFSLFRGEPFRKMYDDWSDDKRLEILFTYENEIISFVKELMKRGRKEEAHKLLKKAEKIAPYSNEIKDLLNK